ncbi:unnamed protein product, partial [Urochloa humidicola]
PPTLYPPPAASARQHPPAAELTRGIGEASARSRAARVGLGGDGARPAPRRCRTDSGRGRGGSGLASGARSGLSRTRAAEQRRGGGAAAAAPSFSLPKLVFLAGRILLVFLAGVELPRRKSWRLAGAASSLGVDRAWARSMLPLLRYCTPTPPRSP